MVYVWFNAKYVDTSYPIRQYVQEIAEKIPKGGHLAAYKAVSGTFVYYYGNIVPVVTDMQELDKHYQQGDWIEANARYVDELIKDSRYNNVFYKQGRKGMRSDASGGLFHKSD